ncbi:autophagy-related protein 13 [Planococcus citri]|uniref:autophagy-related protein 13 n=1 Tax=Planococcus citri TaxID=170843 RepID=UPI0031F8F645
MTSDILTVHDRTELIKLLKTLILKSAYVIVGSRDGIKTNTKCNPDTSGYGTFNVAVREIAEVERDVKKVMGSFQSDRWSMCVEVYLKTVDGDMMTLETWNISLASDYFDNSTSYVVYNRLGILLRSLLAITRVVPAYRYSRRQSPDSYNIGYRIYPGEPQYNSLGEKCQQLKVGTVTTPMGTVNLVVHYRTVMTISPQPSGIDTSIMVKSDHFRPDLSPKHNRNQTSDENNTSLSDESSYKVGAFVESRRESLIPLDSDQLLPDVPFGSLLNNNRTIAASPPPTATAAPVTQHPTNEDRDATTTITAAAPNTGGGVNTNVGVDENELSNRLKAIETNDKEDPNANNVVSTPVAKSTTSYNDDFIVVDLVKPPFAESTGNIELGTFYQEWKSAPPLQTCPTDPKVIDQVGDLTSQLATYETSLKEFDSVVTSLCNGGADCDEDEEEDDDDEANRTLTPATFVTSSPKAVTTVTTVPVTSETSRPRRFSENATTPQHFVF